MDLNRHKYEVCEEVPAEAETVEMRISELSSTLLDIQDFANAMTDRVRGPTPKPQESAEPHQMSGLLHRLADMNSWAREIRNTLNTLNNSI